MLKLAVDNLARPAQLMPLLGDLGLRHVAYGVQRADFAPLGDALIAAVAELEGPAWTSETEGAWRTTYDAIVVGMLRGFEAGRLPVVVPVDRAGPTQAV
jgi:hemoglobin-like flavoprotein